MKLIAVTQREIFVSETKEQRDSIDRRWYDFFSKTNLLPLLLPNDLILAAELLNHYRVAGILLTGGGDISALNGHKKEREGVEEYLIELSIKNKLPLLGICRGMQKIQNYFGIKLQRVDGHIMDVQEIVVDGKKQVINSYHNYGTTETNQHLLVSARAHDNVVKAVNHQNYSISGIMWHPERCESFRNEDLNFFKKFYASSDTGGGQG